MKATFIKQVDGMKGDARLFKLDDGRHVVVSAVNAFAGISELVGLGGPETFIFAADGEGNITSWTELPGSFKGGLDHRAALEGAGWEVADD